MTLPGRRSSRCSVARGSSDPNAATYRISDLSQPAPDLDEDYINYRTVGESGYSLLNPTFDDLTAALGLFVFRVAVGGTVTRRGDGLWAPHEVTIDEVGVYVRDSYDFEGEQNLGNWDETNLAVRGLGGSGTPVTNKNFHRWREETSKGGDFLVFSDVKRTVLDPAVTFVV